MTLALPNLPKLCLHARDVARLKGAELKAALELKKRGELEVYGDADDAPEANWPLPDWEPQPKQALFLESEAGELLYGGGAGGGKSDGMINWAVRYCKRNPGAQGLIVRRKLTDMKRPRAIIPRSQEILAGTGWAWKEGEKKWVAPDGSVIQFGQVQNDADVIENYQGSQPEFLGIEEAGQFTPFQINFLIGRVRSERFREEIRLTANPGGPGHAYLKRRYVDTDPEGTGRVWQPEKGEGDTEDPATRAFIKALVDDNPALMRKGRQYLAKLENLPEPIRSAYRWGRWDIFIGQYFSEWDEAVHVCNPLPVEPNPKRRETYDEFGVPDWWPRIAGGDWGYGHPTVVYWARVSPEGIVYIYRELRLRFTPVDGENGIAARLRSYPDQPEYFAFGSDIFTRQRAYLGGPTIAEQFQDEDVLVTNPTMGKTRIHGWMQVRRYLQWRGLNGERMENRPLLRVFRDPSTGKPVAPYLLKCLPEMQYSKTDSEDMERKDIDPETGEGGDDEASALMHLLMSRPYEGKEPEPEKDYGPNSLAALMAEQEEKARRNRRTRLDR